MQRMNKAKDAKRRARKAEKRLVAISTTSKRIENKKFKKPRTQKHDPWFC